MKFITVLLFLCSFGMSTLANSITLVPITSSIEEVETGFTFSIRNTNDLISNTFLSSEKIKLLFNIKVNNDAVSQTGNLYLGNQWGHKPMVNQWGQNQWGQTRLKLIFFRFLTKKLICLLLK